MARRKGSLALDHLKDLCGLPNNKPAPPAPPAVQAEWTVRAGSRLEGQTAAKTFRIAGEKWAALDADGRSDLFRATLAKVRSFADSLMLDHAHGWVDVAYVWHGPIEGDR